MNPKTSRSDDALLGCLLGGAVGDALGLPAEGLSRRRLHRMWGGEWRHRLVCGRGMFSDDTEHTMMVGAALIRHREDTRAFQRELARSLRWWLAALPAGTGLATARSIIRLWCGVSPERSGVRSAGNGAAMRSAILGVYFADDENRRQAFVRASTRITHTDPRAEEGAQMVAEAASLAVRGVDAQACLARLRQLVVSAEMHDRFVAIERGLSGAESVARFAEQIGCGEGVSGFAPNTVAVALYAWLRHRGDFRGTLTSAMGCGGDVDSVGAIVGGYRGDGGG
jgi:ADP-ribosyl-[dinitrogen reductase] hydrolase